MKFGTIAMKFGKICFIQQMAQNQWNLAYFGTVDFYRRQYIVKSTLSMVTTLLLFFKAEWLLGSFVQLNQFSQILSRQCCLISRPGFQVQILDKYHTDIMHSRLRPMYIATCLSEPKGQPLSSGAPLLTPWLHSGPCPEHKGSGQFSRSCPASWSPRWKLLFLLWLLYLGDFKSFLH